MRLICITPERHLQTTGGCKYCLRVARNQQLEHTLRLETAARATITPVTVATGA